MSKEYIYKHFGEEEQLKRLQIACNKLIIACNHQSKNKNNISLNYLIRKIANVEFLTEQIKDYYRCEDKVYCRKYELQSGLVDKIKGR